MRRGRRNVGGIEQAVAAPSDAEKPRARFDPRPRITRFECGGRAREAVEARRRGMRIGKRTIADDTMVLLRIEEHVAEHVARFGRRPKVATVITIRPEAAFAPEQRIEATCDAHFEPCNATREPALVRRFDDEVKMIGLDREVNDLEVLHAPLRQIVTLLEQHTFHDALHRLAT